MQAASNTPQRSESSAQARQAVQAFYDAHPYPPPVESLDDYRQRWQDDNRRRASYHLYWPDQPYRTDLRVLVAGCGTSQAAKHALREPHSQVTAELYDPATGVWSQASRLSVDRYFHTATLLPGGRVLVVAGVSNTDQSSAELFSLGAGN